LARWFVVFSAAWLFVGTQALSQDVTLSSRDGSIEVSGALIGYDGEFYRIRSEYGDLTLDGTGVICDGPGCPDLSTYVARLTISGSPLMGQRLMPLLLHAFAKDAGYVVEDSEQADVQVLSLKEAETEQLVAEFTVDSVSNAEGFAHLIAGSADLVMSTRSVLPNEIALAVEAGLGNLQAAQQSKVLALDAIVPIVSSRNPMRQISVSQLAAIFHGDVKEWTELNGVDGRVYAHVQRGDVAVYRNFLESVLLPTDKAYGSNVTFHDNMDAVLDAVARDPFAIGLGRRSRIGKGRVLDLIGECGFASDATPEALKAEDYPIPAPMFLYWRGARLPRVARELLQFMDTPAAQIAIVRAGFVDQGITRTGIKRQGDRLANAIGQADGAFGLERLQALMTELTDRSRLSLSFRFQPGSRGLDPQSLSNVRLLANALESGTLSSRDILFVGFASSSDGTSEPEDVQQKSLNYSRDVLQRVLNAAATIDRRGLRVHNIGFGDVMPLACNTETWGQRLNNRVEVWVR